LRAQGLLETTGYTPGVVAAGHVGWTGKIRVGRRGLRDWASAAVAPPEIRGVRDQIYTTQGHKVKFAVQLNF
jgi:hypothetical protein